VACVWGNEIYMEEIGSRSLTRKEKKAKTKKKRQGRRGASKQSEGAKRNTDQSQFVPVLPQSFHPTCRATWRPLRHPTTTNGVHIKI